MPKRISLSIYRMRENVDGERVNFENVLRDPGKSNGHKPTAPDDLDFESKLYISVAGPRKPSWAEFVDNAFEDLPIPEVIRIDGVLLVKVKEGGKSYMFAFTFGQGRHLLEPSAIHRAYGLSVALNAMYSEAPEVSRVRSVDSKTVAGNTFNTRRQADRRATFEDFRVDTKRDFLRAIVGNPVDSEYWGTRMSGGDNITASPEIDFNDLGGFCRRIVRMYSDGTYPDEFDWVDNLRPISDSMTLEKLRSFVVNTFSVDENLSIAVPELIDWDDVSNFSFSFAAEISFSDPEDADLIAILKGTSKPKKLSVANMRRWRLEAYHHDGHVIHSWPLVRCLTGQFEFDGDTYIVSEGEYFLVDAGFLNELDTFIANISAAKYALPVAVDDPNEGVYNENAASSSKNYLLLDKRTVKINSSTSAIEICDILTDDGAFIHVKRKLGSSSLRA